MTTLKDIEKAMTELPAEQLAEFRAWFEEFEAARFDERIERDAKAGRLDRLPNRRSQISAPAAQFTFDTVVGPAT